MPVSRRRFLQGAAVGTAATSALIHVSSNDSVHAQSSDPQATSKIFIPIVRGPFTGAGAISPEAIVMNRMAYGPRPGDLERVRTMGLNAYIEEQLNPNNNDDALCNARLAGAKIKRLIRDSSGNIIVNEVPGLGLVNQTAVQLWSRQRYDMKIDWTDRMRPFEEVRVSTWIRAVYSKWQLREVLVDFWHNHFNVNAGADQTLVAALPEYDMIMRRNCFGNFRQFCGEVGTSVAMLYYLDNVNNRATGGEGGNENYARELFELHTLGSDNYFKFYDDRSAVGTTTYQLRDGTTETFTRGYIDKDVYEAAACFTGWTVKNGDWRLPDIPGTDDKPNDGSFFYYDQWHESGSKIVLGKIIDNDPRPENDMQDGRDVLNLVCYHIGTARHICTKLVRRLIADDPPKAVIDAAVDEWMNNRTAPDQLKKVVRVILQSEAFRTTWGKKFKRPFEHMVSFFRAVEAELPVDVLQVNGKPQDGDYWNSFFWNFQFGGQRLYEWPTPTGHPDLTSFWATTNGMLRRWNLPQTMSNSWGGNVKYSFTEKTDFTKNCIQIVDFWINRIFGYQINPNTRNAMIDFLAMTSRGGNPNLPPANVKDEWSGDKDAVPERLQQLVYLLAATPDFQLR
jgi:uncharacterized protein (DUF1800 family)